MSLRSIGEILNPDSISFDLSAAAVIKPQLLSFRRVLYNAICRGFYMIL
jgi:hypothetical protein